MVTIKTEKEIEILAEGGSRLATVLAELSAMVKPGLETAELEKRACEMIEEFGGKPSFKGYRTSKKDKPFTTALCVSINNQVVHVPAIPSRTIKEGDIVSIDIGMEYKGLFTDMAASIGAGKMSNEAEKLLKVTKKSLELAIEKLKPGLSLFELGKTIEDYVKSNGFSVVRQLVGHGVGYKVHEEPNVPNYAVNELKNFFLKEGMVIAVEPMVNVGGYEIEVEDDEWTVVTKDKSLSAHFEHTIAITKDGYRIITVK